MNNAQQGNLRPAPPQPDDGTARSPRDSDTQGIPEGANAVANLGETAAEVGRPLAILGLGLIGGSLLRRCHAAGATAFGWNRSAATVDAAKKEGYDASTDLTAVLTRASAEDALLVIAVPFFALDDLLPAIARTAPQCVLTDVVSIKAAVLEAVTRHGLASRYVGAHPMAGTAHSGWEATDSSLFEDATWVVTTTENSDASIVATVSAFGRMCGSRIVTMGPEEHDAAVARVSHLPHLLAEALAAVAADEELGGGPQALELAAGSFRDGTRVAGTAPELVRAMCETNGPALLPALDAVLALLTDARERLAQRKDIADLVDRGYAGRRLFEGR